MLALLEELRGKESKRAWARRLRVSPRMVAAIYAGDRKPGQKVISALVREYPTRSAEIVEQWSATK